jgi:hypothetical protein
VKSIQSIRALFVVGGLYDGVLGLAFLLAGPEIYGHFNISQPNHPGYLQFPALLLLVFAWMFFAVAFNPSANRNLIFYGIFLKLSYSGIVFYYWMTSGVPAIWKPFAVIDLAFAALFAWAIAATRIAPSTD